MLDSTVPIIEDETVSEVQLERGTRSWLCAFRLHRRTRWSKPFSRKGVSMFISFGSPPSSSEQVCWYQVRECLGCGEREERSI